MCEESENTTIHYQILLTESLAANVANLDLVLSLTMGVVGLDEGVAVPLADGVKHFNAGVMGFDSGDLLFGAGVSDLDAGVSLSESGEGLLEAMRLILFVGLSFFMDTGLFLFTPL